MQGRLSDFMRPVPAEHVDEALAFYAARPPGRGPRNLAELRQARAARRVETSDAAVVVTIAEAAGRSVPVRIITPTGLPPRGVHLDIHGGGFYMDSAARNDTRNQQLADSLGTAVVSVDYRLAPENPWPAAPDDCEAAAVWLTTNTERLFGTSRLTIGGFSAGSTLAMTTLLRLRDRGVNKEFAGGVLQFGTYDLSGQTPAGRLITDEYFLDAYTGHVADRTLPDVSPIYADLHELPPLLLVVGESDILLEDNTAMASRLAVAGAEVDLRIYQASPHGFTNHPTAMASTARTDIEHWLLNCLG
ncbi:acetyl esterase/lipase [Williamsia limnetica]|uniref:Acetyl esterase/lipase n=1 Tax=Williamsia limnetica TaxID=882452 RepID=A0A318RG28_WILLI|nr:alpha/beta hydrolase [Williamsia limnetica]PYE11967.1 acetyl esterase/lipase [Williamsia limnetica]